VSISLVQYVRFKTRAGSYTGTPYQNFFINETKSYGGVTYSYAPFAIAINAGSKGGDRSENSLIAPNSAISVNLFAEAVLQSYLLEVKTMQLSVADFSDVALISDELWRVASLNSDEENVTLRLMSPLDAVRGQVPRRILTSSLVGSLPTSATLTSR
jgi:hypothetical protein